MEDRVNEGYMPGAKEIIALDKTKLRNMGQCICKINGKENIGTGFFCKIKYGNEFIKVLITIYHIIDKDYLEDKNILKFYINNTYQVINLDKHSLIYSSISDEYDIIMVKIKEENEFNDYLEIDENIFRNKSEMFYKDEPIYILHYPNADIASVSNGKGIEQINNYDIRHFCNTQSGSSGAPILSSFTNKVIGIHKAFIKKGYNIGTFLKFPLNELNQKYTKKPTDKINKIKDYFNHPFFNKDIVSLNSRKNNLNMDEDYKNINPFEILKIKEFSMDDDEFFSHAYYSGGYYPLENFQLIKNNKIAFLSYFIVYNKDKFIRNGNIFNIKNKDHFYYLIMNDIDNFKKFYEENYYI